MLWHVQLPDCYGSGLSRESQGICIKTKHLTTLVSLMHILDAQMTA